jgi:hypothetical protein
MARTVHWLQSKNFLLDFNLKHVVLKSEKGMQYHRIVLPMARGLPELAVVHVRRDDFRESAADVLPTDVRHQRVVNASAMGEKEAAPGAKIVEEKQFLLASNLAMVALRCFFLDSLPFLK